MEQGLPTGAGDFTAIGDIRILSPSAGQAKRAISWKHIPDAINKQMIGTRDTKEYVNDNFNMDKLKEGIHNDTADQIWNRVFKPDF